MRTFIKYLSYLCFGLTFLICCRDAEIAPKEYPYVLMERVSTSKSGAEFTANVLSLGNETILSHGFVWGDKPDPTIVSNDFKSISSDLATGQVVLEINSGLRKDKVYHVRPFVKTKSFLVYGSQLSFTSEGSNPPQILSFTPGSGPVGTRIEITGNYFGLSAKSNTVKLGEYTAEVDSATQTRLYVRVPQVTEPGEVNITVETAGMMVRSERKFDIYFPWLKLSSTHSINSSSSSFTIAGKVWLINANTSSGLLFDSSDGSWQPFNLPDNAGPAPEAFSVSDKGYALLKNGFYQYDPASNSWARKADFPDIVVRDIYTFSIGFDQVGIIGSCYNNQKVWAYDPSTNTWSRKADFPGNFALTTYPVWGSFSFSTGNSGYLGVSQSAFAINTLWEYNVNSDSWKSKAPLPSDAYGTYACMKIGDQVYVGLGTNFEWADGYVSNKIWKYNHAGDRWERFRDCPVRMAVYASFGVGNKGYVFSGFTRYSRALKEIWEFNPREN